MRKPESASDGEFSRQVWRALLLIILSALIGTGLLILSEFLPAEPMDRNLEQSADIFQATGKFPNLHTWCSSRLDNYSDAIMLMMAGNVSAEHPVEHAMMSYYPVMGELDPVQIITRHYIQGVPYEEYEPYSRYWHGYGVIYRLLLQLFDYHRIRQLNMALQVGLILVLCVEMYRAGEQGKRMILPLLISYGMLAPFVMGLNLEYSLGFYVSMFSVLILLVLHRKGRIRELEIFVLLFSGIGTAYWDVLTYPMAALGLSLVAAFCLAPERELRQSLIRLIRLVFFWGMGYGLMWVSKWIIGTILTGQNVFEEGISNFLLRTSSEAYGETVSAWETIWSNLSYFLHTPVSFLMLTYLLVLTVMLVMRMTGGKADWKMLAEGMLPFFLIACIPLAWCAITKNHAGVHFWLASKGFVVTSMALMCGLAQVWPGQPEQQK